VSRIYFGDALSLYLNSGSDAYDVSASIRNLFIVNSSGSGTAVIYMNSNTGEITVSCDSLVVDGYNATWTYDSALGKDVLAKS